MHLVYFDESGNSGNNLNDAEQPISVLGALIVPETCWQAVESDLEGELARLFPKIAAAGEEIHSGDLRGSRGCFRGAGVPERVALRDAWLAVAHQHGLKEDRSARPVGRRELLGRDRLAQAGTGEGGGRRGIKRAARG